MRNCWQVTSLVPLDCHNGSVLTCLTSKSGRAGGGPAPDWPILVPRRSDTFPTGTQRPWRESRRQAVLPWSPQHCGCVHTSKCWKWAGRGSGGTGCWENQEQDTSSVSQTFESPSLEKASAALQRVEGRGWGRGGVGHSSPSSSFPFTRLRSPHLRNVSPVS